MKKEIDDVLEPILVSFNNILTTTFQGHAITTYLKGSAEVIKWGKTKLTDRPIFYEGPPMNEAISYANKHCAKLVTKVNQETKERLRGVIANAIKEKKGVDGLAREIRKELLDMSKYRSKVIALTETSNALQESFINRCENMGVTGKRVIDVPQGDYPCDICIENRDEGDVPIDFVFKSGHSHPPFHPNCHCALAPVMIKITEYNDNYVSKMAEKCNSIVNDNEAIEKASSYFTDVIKEMEKSEKDIWGVVDKLTDYSYAKKWDAKIDIKGWRKETIDNIMLNDILSNKQKKMFIKAFDDTVKVFKKNFNPDVLLGSGDKLKVNLPTIKIVRQGGASYNNVINVIKLSSEYDYKYLVNDGALLHELAHYFSDISKRHGVAVKKLFDMKTAGQPVLRSIQGFNYKKGLFNNYSGRVYTRDGIEVGGDEIFSVFVEKYIPYLYGLIEKGEYKYASYMLAIIRGLIK